MRCRASASLREVGTVHAQPHGGQPEAPDVPVLPSHRGVHQPVGFNNAGVDVWSAMSSALSQSARHPRHQHRKNKHTPNESAESTICCALSACTRCRLHPPSTSPQPNTAGLRELQGRTSSCAQAGRSIPCRAKPVACRARVDDKSTASARDADDAIAEIDPADRSAASCPADCRSRRMAAGRRAVQCYSGCLTAARLIGRMRRGIPPAQSEAPPVAPPPQPAGRANNEHWGRLHTWRTQHVPPARPRCCPTCWRCDALPALCSEQTCAAGPPPAGAGWTAATCCSPPSDAVLLRSAAREVSIASKPSRACFIVRARPAWRWHQTRAVDARTRPGSGLENLALIPGPPSAPRRSQNIGAYVSRNQDRIHAWKGGWTARPDRSSGVIASNCAFGERDSAFKQQPIRHIVHPRIRIARGPRCPGLCRDRRRLRPRCAAIAPTPATVADAVCAAARAKLPTPSAHLADAAAYVQESAIIPLAQLEPLRAAHATIPVYPWP
ncbi:hypothetical protein FQR65_LT20901 [Abscondita terminalis]|nr:hypothetical protein FQR65_LT20901 [Abscondita terminalis]